MTLSTRTSLTGREAAALAITQAASRFDRMPPTALDTTKLSAREATLAMAIYRTTLQRWLTLTYLLDLFLKKPISRLEPAMQGVLLTASAQLVFMDRLPTHAVVDESVKLARRLVRPKAAGMANAVLRRMASLVDAVVPDLAWESTLDRLPCAGGAVVLTEPCLPCSDDPVTYASVLTSHPTSLVQAWFETMGPPSAMAVLRHSLETPTTFVVDEHEQVRPWDDTHDALTTYLSGDPLRRVQDPTSVRAVASTRSLAVASAYDACAGRGTKTRQLASVHRSARVWATDPDAQRSQSLAALPGLLPQVRMAKPSEPVDLLVLDVPCSNSGVLARRPEARYRYRPSVVRDLVALQQRIINANLRHVRSGGYILYATCSLEPAENQAQARYLVRQTQGQLVQELATLPAGSANTYHDGGYHALIQLPPAATC